MGVPQLSQCCCGCTLEKGSLIIGWLGVVGGVLSLVGALLRLLGADTGAHHSYGTTDNVIYAISGIVTVLLSIMLILGVKRRVRKYVQLWVIVSVIGLIINLLTVLIAAIGVLGSDPGAAIGVIIFGFILAGIAAYLILVVHSFYREMGSENSAA